MDASGGPSIQDFSDQVRRWMLAEEDADQATLDKYIKKMSDMEKRFCTFCRKENTPRGAPTASTSTPNDSMDTQDVGTVPASGRKRNGDNIVISARDAENAKAAKTLFASSSSESTQQSLTALTRYTSAEVQTFAPLVSTNTIASNKFRTTCNHAAEQLCMDTFGEPFDENSPVFEMDEDATPELLRARVVDLSRTLRELLLGAATTHAAAYNLHRVYWLANFTQGANWDTYKQLDFRAHYDRTLSEHDASVVPVVGWHEQVRMAMATLGQLPPGASTTGIDVGAICPDLEKIYFPSKGPAASRTGRGGGGTGGSRTAEWRTGGAGSSTSETGRSGQNQSYHSRDAGSRAPTSAPPRARPTGQGSGGGWRPGQRRPAGGDQNRSAATPRISTRLGRAPAST